MTTATTLDIKATCAGCQAESAGRLHFSTTMQLVDSDGGMVFEDGWRCHNCLGEPWESGDATAVILR